MDYSANFLTLEKIEKAIELPFSDICEMLSRYVYFKGLVWNSEHEITYVDGYFIIESTEINYYEFTAEEIENDYHLTEPDTPDTERLITIKGSEFSNNADLIDKILPLKGSQDIDEALYSYKQLCQLMKKFGCPQPLSTAELSKKDYAYDVKLLNQKSNFTLDDAAKIAANIYYTSHTPIFSQLSHPLKNHYMELLSDCIKGSNQDDFKLHTVELWCTNNDEFGDRYSKTYENGTYLKQKATLDYQLTIISKQEFVRWCEYENVDTGLTYELKIFDESIEALKAENEKLKTQIRPQGFQQAPPSIPNNDSEKIKELNKKIGLLTEESSLLKESSFPFMTLKLKTILEAQKEFWVDYNKDQPPSQQLIINHLTEQLGLKMSSNGPNRTAAELAKAIQPDEIKRK
jgi:hypothetical protein